MHEPTVFAIGILGLKRTESGVLRTLFSMHSGRSWVYELKDSPMAGNYLPDIWLVDRDDSVAIGYWNALRSVKPEAISIGVRSGDTAESAEDAYTFTRPLRMAHLIKALDEVVLKRLHYHPPISDNTQLSRERRPVPPEVHQRRAFKALVVDDSPTIHTLMTTLLNGLGFDVVLADGADSALPKLRDTRYDIIFLDVVMPGMMDGYRLCKLIKSQQLLRDCPVMMLTSRDTMIDKVRGKLCGADAYLTKPVDQGELTSAIDRFMPAYRVEAAATREANPPLAAHGGGR